VKYLVQLCVLRKEEDMKINNNFIIRLPCDSIELPHQAFIRQWDDSCKGRRTTLRIPCLRA
jgi:hypothetical protein